MLHVYESFLTIQNMSCLKCKYYYKYQPVFYIDYCKPKLSKRNESIKSSKGLLIIVGRVSSNASQ